MPHWLAADRKGNRLVGRETAKLGAPARFDPDKGTLSLDQTFREPGATCRHQFDRQECPRESGRAIVHGALFGPQ